MEKIDETRFLRWPDADLQPLWPKLRIGTAHDDIDANHKNSAASTSSIESSSAGAVAQKESSLAYKITRISLVPLTYLFTAIFCRLATVAFFQSSPMDWAMLKFFQRLLG